MPISEIVQPRQWFSLLSSPASLHTAHSARKCRRYLRNKDSLVVHPLHDRQIELVYVIREHEDAFRMFRRLGNLENSPLGFDLTVEEGSEGSDIELRFAMPRWFWTLLAVGIVALAVAATFFMDWWPSLLTLAILALLLLGGLHVAATDRRELERFLVERFGEPPDPFNEDAWDS